MSILYVDDDPDDRFFFQEAVRSIDENLVCSTVNDGLQALDYLQSHDLPDIVFMDINMPLMNGKTCLAAIKSNKATSHLPVFILTTSNSTEEKRDCTAIGASDFIRKPSSYVQMKQILTTIFSASDRTLLA